MPKQRFAVTPAEVAALVTAGFVVEASYASTAPGIYLDLATVDGMAQGEALVKTREDSAGQVH